MCRYTVHSVKKSSFLSHLKTISHGSAAAIAGVDLAEGGVLMASADVTISISGPSKAWKWYACDMYIYL